jgi:dienelactone hydrolase
MKHVALAAWTMLLGAVAIGPLAWCHACRADNAAGGHEQEGVELGERVVVAMAQAEVRGWGPYQFPGLERLPDGTIRISVHVEADSAVAYGLPPLQAVSADEGKTWTMLPKKKPVNGTTLSCSTPATLPNGDRLSLKLLRPLKAAGIKLPPKPFGQVVSYGHPFSYYRVEDLPPECRDGWWLYRYPVGAKEPVEEKAVVRLPGELRYTVEGVMPFPWGTGHRLVLAPDGAVWAVGEDCRVVGGELRQKWAMTVLRSTDNGQSFDLWGEIPYAPDPAVDSKAASRDGFTEPCVNFMPDGSVLCFLRTTDGNGTGPIYQSRSLDNGKTWSKPAVFDGIGVWPQMLTLKNGVTLAVYGRPGLFVRASRDPAGAKWSERVEVVKPGAIMADTCSYASLLPLADDTALLAYSDFNVPGPDGTPRKTICVRTVKATVKAAEVHSRKTAAGTAFAMLPSAAASPAPTLLLFAMADADTLTIEPYCRIGRLLQAQGWNVVSLDLPCHGADRRPDEPAELAGWAARTKAGDDIVAGFRNRVNDVVEHLVAANIADPARIAAAGTSRGGFMAFQAAAGNPRIRAVAAFAPVTDLTALSEFAGQDGNPLVNRLALSNAADKIAGRAAWITIGNSDARVGTDKAVAFAKAVTDAAAAHGLLPRVTLRVPPTPGHASLPEWHDEAAAWLSNAVMSLDGVPPEPGVSPAPGRE